MFHLDQCLDLWYLEPIVFATGWVKGIHPVSCGTFRHSTMSWIPVWGSWLKVGACSLNFSQMSAKFSFKNARPQLFGFCCVFTYFPSSSASSSSFSSTMSASTSTSTSALPTLRQALRQLPSSVRTAGPQPGTFRAQCAPLDLNLGHSQLNVHRWTSTWDLPSSVCTAGPQPGTFPAQCAPLDLNLGPAQLSVHRWTSTAR